MTSRKKARTCIQALTAATLSLLVTLSVGVLLSAPFPEGVGESSWIQ